MKKAMYVALGFLFMALGALGVILPILPTTPFLLVAALCFTRGSDRLKNWFEGTNLYKKNLESFARERSLSRAAKWKILLLATAMLLAMFFITDKVYVKGIALTLIGIKYYVFLFRIKTTEEEGKGKPGISRRLLSLSERASRWIYLTVLVNVAGLLSSVAAVTSLAMMVDNPSVDFRLLAVVFLTGAAGKVICAWLAPVLSGRAAAETKTALRGRIYDKLLRLGLSYRDHLSDTSFMQVAVEGVEQLQVYMAGYLPQLFYSVLAPLTLFALLALVNVRIALVLLILTPLIPISIAAIRSVSRKHMREHWSRYTGMGEVFLENLQGLTTLKIFSADEKKHQEMNRLAEGFRQTTMKVLQMQLGSVTAMDIIAYGSTAAGIAAALLETASGRLPLWAGIAVILLSSQFFLPLRALGSFFHSSMNGAVAAEKIFQLLDAPERDGEKKGAVEFGDIRLKDCRFAYSGRDEILKGVDMEILKGSFISVVGPSGCGKSTLAGILSGKHRTYEGSAAIGSMELKEASDASLCETVVPTSHNSHLFKGTVKDNLLLGCPEATEAEMETALAKVKLLDFVKSQGGLSFEVSEGGGNLSGGQRQRLSIARSLLKKGGIYIFDEATSGVDADNEWDVVKTIKDLAGEKTVLLITHRMALASEAEKIFVLKDGKFCAEGSHRNLYNKNKEYTELYNIQMEVEMFLEEEVMPWAGNGF